MKRLTVIAALVVGFVSLEAGASTPAPGRIGAGVIFGEPTGLTGKYWTSRKTAFDFGLAYSFGSFVLLYADYLHHFPGAIRGREEFLRQLVPYVGVGATMFLAGGDRKKDRYFDRDSSFGVGARIPLGIEWLPPAAPVGVFLELAPGVGVLPAVFGFVQGGLGVRYYF